MMALRISYTTEHGITCPDAYCIIKNSAIEKVRETVTVDGGDDIHTDTFYVIYSGFVYSTEANYLADKSAITSFHGNFELDVAGSKNQYNLLKQCYNHVKTQPDFSGAIDC
tara:strand:+ start:255 stop:587 length:333 start_codon:yes stop_codon:yes gene_type:complete